MKLHNSVKLIRKLEIADLDGEFVMIDFKTGKYVWLKGIANDIWEYLNKQEKLEISDLITNLRKEYDVEESICNREVREFLDRLVALKFAKYC